MLQQINIKSIITLKINRFTLLKSLERKKLYSPILHILHLSPVLTIFCLKYNSQEMKG